MLGKSFFSIISELPYIQETLHFVFHYGLRNPQHNGVGQGTNGLRNVEPLLVYADALERVYSSMTQAPWNRSPPKVDSSGKTQVYICDLSAFGGSPFTAYDREGIPFVALPCRSSEPVREAELRKCAADAAHEGAHVFGFSKRPFYELSSEPWAWFDEGLAVFLEEVVLSGNLDHLRFQVDWIDRPEEPLDDWGSAYQSGYFVRYLARKMGMDFVDKLWTQSQAGETPFGAFERMLPSGQRFVSPDPRHEDLFASGYAMDSYFLCDPASVCFSPDVWARYGDRAVAGGFVLRAGDTATAEGTLRHLACRYYRIYPHSDVSTLEVELTTEVEEDALLKAEVALVTPERRRGWRRVLDRRGRRRKGQPRSVSISTEDLKAERDHLVLVVTNCVLSDPPLATRRFKPAGCPYRIKLRAV